MLEPRSRLLLLDALSPPAGFTFDEGIGTTFTLDLVALLTAPLAFTLFDTQDPASAQVAGSLEVLHSVRQYAGRLTVFCHASYVSVPKAILTQYAFLEDTIVECQGQNRSLFHPKVWLLRFVNERGERLYRLLCLTRNLTFANSWDTALVLEGGPTAHPQPRNSSLAGFIAALPGLAVRAPSEAVLTRVAMLAEEVRSVDFALPDGFTDLNFWPLGIDGAQRWPFQAIRGRLLVVSPFVTAGCLERLATGTHEAILVSSREDLSKLPRRPSGFGTFHTLHDAAVAEFLDSEAAEGRRDAALLTGLHAKCYLVERGDDVHIWTGSANATDAAFSGNLEFLTELVGPKRQFGIDQILVADADDLRFGHLLADANEIVATKTIDPDEDDLRKRVELTRALLSEAQLRAIAEPAGQDRWSMALSGGLPEPLPDGVTVWCWPLPAAGRRQRLDATDGQIGVRFPELSFDALSAFFVCRIEARLHGHETDCQFVLKASLDGTPSDRGDRILRALVKDRAALMRFLFLLLTEDGEGMFVDGERAHDGVPEGWEWSAVAQPGLFELLVRALERRPARLDEIARLVAQVKGESTDEPVLPPGFTDIWDPVWAARTERADV